VLISLVVPVFNHADLTVQCIRSLQSTTSELSTLRPGYQVEIVVVDDGSTDDTADRLRVEFAETISVLRNQKNEGFAVSCNRGADVARGDVVLFVNNDVVALAGWLPALIKYHTSHPETSVIGSRLLYPDGRIQHAGVAFSSARFPYHVYRGADGDLAAARRSKPMLAVTGAVMWVDKPLFMRLGGFDPAFRNGFEDIDFCLRVGQNGGVVAYCGDAVLIHLESQTRPLGGPELDQNIQEFARRWHETVVPDDLATMQADGLVDVRPGPPTEIHVDPRLRVRFGHQLTNYREDFVPPWTGQAPHVAIVGTFDVQNYGDLLFPIIAERALRLRMGDIEVARYSRHEREDGSWPFAVEPVEHFAHAVQRTDCLLVGGGDLLRLDPPLENYVEPNPNVDQQLGLWLQPATIASAAGVSVCWNAPGLVGTLTDRVNNLLAPVLAESAYVSARDTRSVAVLDRLCGRAQLAPDTAFGLPDVMPVSERQARLAKLRSDFQLAPKYVLIQPHRYTAAIAQRIADESANRGLQLVIAPIGAVLGDHPDLLGSAVHNAKALVLKPDLHPLDLAALVSGATGVVALSLHAAITAATFGVPVVRPGDYCIPKYRVLDGLQSVRTYSDEALPEANEVFHHFESSSDVDVALVAAHRAASAAHWDRIATELRVAVLTRANRSELGASRVARFVTSVSAPQSGGAPVFSSDLTSDGAPRVLSETHSTTRNPGAGVDEVGQSELALIDTLREERERNEKLARALRQQAEAVRSSASWRITAPLRLAFRIIRRQPFSEFWSEP
jgi:GT2 family glycosyltransferase